ncbi:MAG TPA: hypothetical protein VM242_07470 [Acidimicrobiales bacterium]|nr:hypothetical protein [Acidimicrobiales bacterium]
MRFVVETKGRLRGAHGPLDRADIELTFDHVAEALAELHDLEADVSANLETSELEFYVVVEAPDSRKAFTVAFDLQDRAMATADVLVEWNEQHARRADLVPA